MRADAPGIPDLFRSDRRVRADRIAFAHAATRTLTAGECALAERYALHMESTSLPTDRHEASLLKTACGHLARCVGTKCLPGPDPPRPLLMRPRLSVPAKIIYTVTGRLPPSATRLSLSKVLVSKGLSAMRPSRPPSEFRLSEALSDSCLVPGAAWRRIDSPSDTIEAVALPNSQSVR